MSGDLFKFIVNSQIESDVCEKFIENNQDTFKSASVYNPNFRRPNGLTAFLSSHLYEVGIEELTINSGLIEELRQDAIRSADILMAIVEDNDKELALTILSECKKSNTKFVLFSWISPEDNATEQFKVYLSSKDDFVW